MDHGDDDRHRQHERVAAGSTLWAFQRIVDAVRSSWSRAGSNRVVSRLDEADGAPQTGCRRHTNRWIRVVEAFALAPHPVGWGPRKLVYRR